MAKTRHKTKVKTKPKTNNGYIRKRDAVIYFRQAEIDFARCKVLDGVIITLGNLGMNAEFMRKFLDLYKRTEVEIDGYFEQDYKDSLNQVIKTELDEELRYANTKEKIDNSIKSFVYPEDFVSFDYRYGIKEMPKK